MASIIAAFLWLGAPAHAEQSFHTIEYSDISGNKQTLDASSAKLTAIHFWATWCVPCIGEMPELNKAAGEYGPKGFRVLPLSLDNNPEKVKMFFALHDLGNLTPYFDMNYTLFYSLRLKGLPTTIFIDSKGNALSISSGPIRWQGEQAKQFLEEHLK
ncbi:MAG: TlpA disulfide reductase family protein [Rickettsiales bacterium]|nr:TlpA disulfide reductase family protein [Rickettsiales bacterium]